MAASPIQYLLHPLGFGVRVMQWGGEGPAVLFVHGLGSHAEIWAPVASALAARGRRCFAIDLPGHGLSQKGPAQDGEFSYTAAGHAELFAALLAELGEERIDVVGSSLGGLFAAAFATRTPELVRTLTLIGSVGLQPLAPERRRWTSEYLAKMDRDSVATRLRNGVFDPAAISDAFVEEAWRMNNSRGAAESFAAIGRYYAEGINDDMQVERLAALDGRVPLLLVWGKQDVTVAYQGAVEALPRLPRATLLALDDTRHIPHVERPGVVGKAIALHLDGGDVGSLRGPGVEVMA